MKNEFVIVWQHRFDPVVNGQVLASSPEEARGLVQAIEARGPYRARSLS